MGIELPDELAGVAAATGAAWPQADEDKLREQARAWRDAQTRLTSLAGDADHAASGAVGALSGPAGEAAGALWTGYVDADEGRLTASARGAGAAADRLDHAADQVAAAKVEIVRHLVEAAKNTDAAQAAASAGHPSALLGVDTVLKGTATNLSALTNGLATAVGPGGGAVDTSPLVDANPGARTREGQAGLLGAVTGLPGHLLSTSDALMTPVAGTGSNGSLAGHALDPVADGATGHPGLADAALGAANEVTGHALDGPAGAVGSAVGKALPAVDHAGDDATGLLSSTMDTPRRLVQQVPPSSAVLGAAPDAGTGPIRVPPVPSAPYGGFLDSRGFDDLATPPSGLRAPGVTVASGITGTAYAPPPDLQNPGFGPGIAQPPAGPGLTAPPPFGVPPPMGPAAPPAPGAAAPVGGVAGLAAPGRSPGASPLRSFTAGPPPPQPYPVPPPEPPRPLPPMGAPRQERESVVALFLVHMFPIGHLPVAADRPARQLAVPPSEVDYAPGLRFPPHDHPRSDLIESSGALEKVRAGLRRLASPPTSPPATVVDGHDPLGGLPERDWHRRFLVGARGGVPEYAWPPGELYPEGGIEEGEPQVLVVGTLLDRFGDIGGRVFAPEGTPFAHRSLPPSAREAGYRRYRVLRDVPMWQALSAGWFGQPGGGVRYRAVYSAEELVTLGYLADVTFEECA